MPVLKETYRHSASSARKFREAVTAWLASYGLGMYDDETSPAFAAGQAAEVAAHLALTNPSADPGTFAVAQYDEKAQGQITKWRDDLPGIVQQFTTELRKHGPLLSYQHSTTHVLEELRFPVKVVSDFGFSELYIDTKAKLACPSEPNPADVIQQAIYWTLREKPTALLYATHKKTLFYPLTEQDRAAGWSAALDIFHRIERFDQRFATPEEAASILALDTSSFYLSNADYAARVLKRWAA